MAYSVTGFAILFASLLFPVLQQYNVFGDDWDPAAVSYVLELVDSISSSSSSFTSSSLSSLASLPSMFSPTPSVASDNVDSPEQCACYQSPAVEYVQQYWHYYCFYYGYYSVCSCNAVDGKWLALGAVTLFWHE
eukprot:3443255-Amphidinium_carterae.1